MMPPDDPQMQKVHFAVPGDLATPTGGYGYARRLFRELPRLGIVLLPVTLPKGFPHPTSSELERTEQVLRELDPSHVLLIDCLAYGAFPMSLIDAIPCRIVALCHHPLALESGLSPETVEYLRRTESAALQRAAHVITTSHATADVLSGSFGIAAQKITAAPPGTDPAPHSPGHGGSECRILSVGAVTPRKGHERLIMTLAGLVDLDWHLTIVGPERDPETTGRLRKLIQSEDLGNRVTLAGALPVTQLTAAYQASDLFVLASEFEGFGMAFAEAMAHGLPVVGLASAAVEEATAGAARLVEPDELGETLAALITNDQERRDLAQRCWTAGQTLMRWSETAAIHARVLEAIAR